MPGRDDVSVRPFSVGVLMLDTRFPRIPGDIGNAATFDFPVRYLRVAGASPVGWCAGTGKRCFRSSSRALAPSSARVCGPSPRAAGSLRAFRKIWRRACACRCSRRASCWCPSSTGCWLAGRVVGIMTVDATALDARHLAGAGVPPEMGVVVAGLETEREFTRVLLGDLPC